MRIILSFKANNLAQLTDFYLNARFKKASERIPPSSSLIDELRSLLPFDVLLTDQMDQVKKIFQFSASLPEQNRFPIICALPPGTPSNPQPERKLYFFDQAAWIEKVEEMLKTTFPEMGQEEISQDLELVPISPENLLSACPLSGGVYLKLSDRKYVRLMKIGYNFEKSDYDYFVGKKKIKTFYIKRQDCYRFASQIQEIIHNPEEKNTRSGEDARAKAEALKEASSEVLILPEKGSEKIAPSPPAPASEVQDKAKLDFLKKKASEILIKRSENQAQAKNAPAVTVAGDQSQPSSKAAEEKKFVEIEKSIAHNLSEIQTAVTQIGITKEIADLTKKNVSSALSEIRAAPTLRSILLQIEKDKDKYISSHSIALSFLACAISRQLEWRSDQTYQKLTLAAFLHDIGIKNQELAAVQTLTELENKASMFSHQEMKAFKDHPIVGAEIARKFKEIPPDVDLIIVQHHERPDGTGFPRKLTHSRISPLSAVFIVAHDLTSFLFEKNNQNVDLSEFLQRHHETYRVAAFRKLLSIVPGLSI